MQAKYGMVPDVNIIRTFSCVASIHVNAEIRRKLTWDGFFGSSGHTSTDIDKVIESAHVLLDEVSKPS